MRLNCSKPFAADWAPLGAAWLASAAVLTVLALAPIGVQAEEIVVPATETPAVATPATNTPAISKPANVAPLPTGPLEPPAAAAGPASPEAAPLAVAPLPDVRLPPPGAAQQAVAPSAVAGLVGNTIISKGYQSSTLIIHLRSDGSAKMLDQDEVLTGKWVNRGDTLCMRFPNDDGESCYAVAVNGKIAVLTDEDGDKRRFDILAGNPNRL